MERMRRQGLEKNTAISFPSTANPDCIILIALHMLNANLHHSFPDTGLVF